MIARGESLGTRLSSGTIAYVWHSWYCILHMFFMGKLIAVRELAAIRYHPYRICCIYYMPGIIECLQINCLSILMWIIHQWLLYIIVITPSRLAVVEVVEMYQHNDTDDVFEREPFSVLIRTTAEDEGQYSINYS